MVSTSPLLPSEERAHTPWVKWYVFGLLFGIFAYIGFISTTTTDTHPMRLIDTQEILDAVPPACQSGNDTDVVGVTRDLAQAYDTLCGFKRSDPYGIKDKTNTQRKKCTIDPLPPNPLKRLERKDVGDVVYFVGDVHGMADQLEVLLDYIDARKLKEKENSTIIFVGDIIQRKLDKNNQEKNMKNTTLTDQWSRRSIRLLRNRTDVHVTRGNNDAEPLSELINKGPAKAIKKYPFLKTFSTDDLVWLASIPILIQLPWLNITVVHAGLIPEKGKPKMIYTDDFVIDNYCSEIQMRGISPDPFQGKSQDQEEHDLVQLDSSYRMTHWYIKNKDITTDNIVRWADVWGRLSNETCHDDPDCKAPMVIFGHDAGHYFQSDPHHKPLALGLDTSCTYGYYLTALRMEADDRDRRSYTQIDCAQNVAWTPEDDEDIRKEPVVKTQDKKFEDDTRTEEWDVKKRKPRKFRNGPEISVQFLDGKWIGDKGGIELEDVEYDEDGEEQR